MKCPKCGHVERVPSPQDPIIFGSSDPEKAESAADLAKRNPGWTAEEIENGLIAYAGPEQDDIRNRLAADGTLRWWIARTPSWTEIAGLHQEDASDA